MTNKQEFIENVLDNSDSEEIGLHFKFLEINLRGEADLKKKCVLKVVEDGIGGDQVAEEWEFDSWEELKEECPTFIDLLAMCFSSEHWCADWRGGNRVLYAESIQGHEGLYDDHTGRLNCDE